VLRQSSTAA